jgi:hypothetical protein
VAPTLGVTARGSVFPIQRVYTSSAVGRVNSRLFQTIMPRTRCPPTRRPSPWRVEPDSRDSGPEQQPLSINSALQHPRVPLPTLRALVARGGGGGDLGRSTGAWLHRIRDTWLCVILPIPPSAAPTLYSPSRALTRFPCEFIFRHFGPR